MKLKNKTVKKLVGKYKDISILDNIGAILGWDLNVNLPPMAAVGRGEQAAFVTNLINKAFLDKEFRKLLESANDKKDLLPEEAAIVRNLNRASDYFTKVPTEIIQEKSKATAEAYVAWDGAKKADKFADFSPHLEKLVEIDLIVAEHLGYRQTPLDALLDLHEPCLTSEFCIKNIVSLQAPLTKLVRRVQKSKKYLEGAEFIDGQKLYPVDLQKKLSQFIAKKMGYRLDSGRIDVSSHPFTTTLGREDVRITTFYKDHDFRDSFSSTMHETGHALYEQNIDQAFDKTPLEYGVSFGIHEALSRFWENQIGRSTSFLKFMTPIFLAFYPEALSKTNEDTFINLFNLVRPSLIRIEADELTYTLHIIVRFELEQELFAKKLKVRDLPEAWRARMKKYLGVVPKTDREGVLQDVHWSGGSFGYFPAYALGNLYASQFLAKIKKEINIDRDLEKGHLGGVLYWLNENVHKHGSLYWPQELVKIATGEALNSKYFLEYLESKYSKIYSV